MCHKYHVDTKNIDKRNIFARQAFSSMAESNLATADSIWRHSDSSMAGAAFVSAFCMRHGATIHKAQDGAAAQLFNFGAGMYRIRE